MRYIEIFIIGVALSMDAFAVSICQGLALKKCEIKNMLKAGIFYGGFQALMPLIGFFLGSLFSNFVERVDHFISFILLLIIGINMIKEAFSTEEEEKNKMDLISMFLFSIATSIDALAVGVTLAFNKANIFLSIFIIGITTFIISGIGIKFGSKIGEKFNKYASIIGGITLIIIGLRILLTHLMN